VLSYSRYQLAGLPVAHAAGLALWSLLQTAASPAALLWWMLWLPVIRLVYDLRTTGIVLLGASPFLAFAAYHWIIVVE
jgi:hypothetical protein